MTNKIKYFVVTLFMVAFYNLKSYSQSNQLDSLLLLVKTMKDDTLKVHTYIDLCRNYLPYSLDSSINYSKKALQLSNKLQFTKGKSDAYYYLGFCYNNMSYFEIASENIKKSLEINIKQKNKSNQGVCYNFLGEIAYKQGNFILSMNNFLNALKLAEEDDNKEHIVFALNNVGMAHYGMMNYDKAFEFYNKSYKMALKFNIAEGLASNLSNLSSIYVAKKEYEKALDFMKKALYVDEKNSNKYGISTDLKNLGDIYYRMNKMDEALNYYSQSLIIKEEINDAFGIATVNMGIGKLYNKIKKYSEAEKYLLQSLTIAKKNGSNDLVCHIYEFLSSNYVNEKDFVNAYNYHKLFKNTSDSIYTGNKNKQLNELLLKYETNKKDAEIKLLTKENEVEKVNSKQQKQLTFFFLFGFIIVLIFAIVIFRYSIIKRNLIVKINEKTELLQAVMDANPNPQYYKDINGKYLGCNLNFEKITGINKNEIIGKTSLEFPTINLLFEQNKIDNEIIETNSFRKYITKEKVADNSTRDFEIIKTVYSNHEKTNGVLGVMVDITHIKNQEEEIREQQKLLHKQENEKIQWDLEYHKKELTEMIIRLTNTSEFIANSVNDLQSILPSLDTESKVKVQSIINKYRSDFIENTWDEFLINFKNAHKEFYIKLEQNFPDLTSNEKRLCIYLFLNMTTKQIATLTYRSQITIENVRIRLRKKLGITDSVINLNTFLQNL